MFVESFKYYKAKSVLPNLADVIDLDSLPGTELETEVLTHYLHSKWRVFTLPKNPGLILIRNPFTAQGQRYWIARCLHDFAKPPNRNNLTAHQEQFPSVQLDDWWQALQQLSPAADQRRRLKRAMRWATLGLHHDWDTKVYDATNRSTVPTDIQGMCHKFATALGFQRPFSAEAAIVNYYTVGHTLAGHTDHSELNQSAPLFSFSFGQTAIFLIGGPTKAQKPTAIYLRSGDVMVMSAESRLCYHAVPRIMQEASYASGAQPWHVPATGAAEQLPLSDNLDALLYSQVALADYWEPYEDYLNDARINMNVRQVHNEANS